MSKEHESWVSDENGKIIGKDTTEYHDDGSSTTTHQEAYYSDLTGAHATKITGVTENDSSGTSTNTEGSRGICFLTTACVEYAGLPDDCRELTTLRRFRDVYVAQVPGGPELISEYYAIAPGIVRAIKQTQERATILEDLLTEIRAIVSNIDAGAQSAAMSSYRAMFERLQRAFPNSGNA
jgi:hypothetical protein